VGGTAHDAKLTKIDRGVSRKPLLSLPLLAPPTRYDGKTHGCAAREAREGKEGWTMPEVYTGKVLIPGDQIDDYFAALKEAEETRAPFRQSLEDLNVAFAASLDKKYSRRTVLKHTSIIDLFIIFLCDYTDIERLEDVTRGMVNSHFRRWYQRKVLDRMDPDEIRVALKKFFVFLNQEPDIHNSNVLEALR